PAAPRTVAAPGGTIRGVAIAGQFAYALNLVPGNPAHTDLLVVDLRAPASPAVVGRTTLAGGSDVKVAGSLVYVAAGGAGLQIVDVGSPLAPAIVGTVDTPGTATAVAVANGHAYVADDTALEVVDVANPARPVIVGSLATTATARPWSTSWRSCPSAPSRRRRTRLGARPEVPPAVVQAGPRVLSRLVAALEGGGLRVLDAPGALRRAVAVEILAVLDVAVTGG